MSPNAPVRWKLRSDLEVIDAAGAGGAAWVIKDPLRLRYFRLQAEEMALLKLLDGQTTWADILRVLQTGFPRTAFSESNLTAFLTSTIQNCLLVTTAPGHGERLTTIKQRESKTSWVRRLGSIVAWRWHGFDPTRLLDTLKIYVGWVFNPTTLVIAFLFVTSVAVYMVSQLERIVLEAPRIAQLFTVGNLPYVAVAFVTLKVLHELGHGIACRRFGGECHELGILFIAFFPLLYCDVSDAWLLRSRWQRALISSAGMIVEFVVAAVAALLWLASVPGVAHTFFLNIVIVASVNTLLVNGNPLLRYDGYYILADLLERPNLGIESRRAAARFFDRLVLGVTTARVSGGSWLEEAAYVVFGLASAAYRIVIMVVILWVFHEAVTPYGLDVFAKLAVLATIASSTVMAVSSTRNRAIQVKARDVNPVRAWTGLATFVAIVVGVMLIPFPKTASAPFVVTAGTSNAVYVSAPGRIVESVRYGQTVNEAGEIAVLTNAELDRSVAEAHGDVQRLEQSVSLIQARRSDDDEASQELPAAMAALEAARSRLDALEETHSRLTIRSDRAGVVFPPRRQASALDTEIVPPDRRETAPSDPPLDPARIGAWLDSQTQLAWIGSKDDWLMAAYLDESDIALIRQNATTELSFHSAPGDVASGQVVQIDASPKTDVPRELVLNGQVAVDPQDPSRSLTTLYRVDVALDADAAPTPLRLYSTGIARIECPPESLARRLWRLICQTFAIKTR